MAETASEGAAMATKSSTTFKVSVLRCRKTGRVLFLEAGKDFVDTLFSFLLLPVGTIIHMLSTAGGQEVKALGGLSSIFESVEKLDGSFLHVDKKSLVQPRPGVAGTCGSTGLLLGLEAARQEMRPTKEKIQLPAVYYGCNSNRCSKLSITEGTSCKECSNAIYGSNYSFIQPVTLFPEDLESLKATIIEKLVEGDPIEEATGNSTGQGFVRENITYMVTDNLEVMPSTIIRSIQVLNKLKVATLADMESTDINLGITQILQLLQSAMTSSTCLNEVLGKK